MFLAHKQQLILHTIICFVSAGIQVGVAFIYQLLTKTALSGNVETLLIASIVALLYMALDSVADFLPRVTKTKLVNAIMAKNRLKLISKIETISEYEMVTSDKNTYLTKLTNDFNIMENDFLKPALSAVLSAFIFLFSLFFALRLELSFAGIIVLLSLFPLLSPYFAKKLLAHKKKSAMEAQNDFFSLFEELIASFITLKTGNSFTKYNKRLVKSSTKLKAAKINFDTTQGLTYALSYFLGALAYSGTWIVGAFFVLYHKIELPDLIAMTTLMSTIAGPLEYLSSSYTDLVSSKKIVADLLDYITLDHKDVSSSLVSIDKIELIELKKVSFSINSKKIITNFNYVFEKGKKYAVTGQSGAGKTTIINLISGIYPLTSGQILIDGIAIDQINPHSLYRKLAYSPQQTSLLTTSIANNVSLLHDYKEDDVIHSLISSGLSDLASHHLLNEIIGPNSSYKLSGGETKRLEIARALFKNSDVLIFDEPTSGLDEKNENLIGELIQAFPDKIIVVSTHSTNKTFLGAFDAIIDM
ncbi:ATP-binding cassette domain-containing protein [Vagococcus allomyrinae]|nr:ABC transporter ATP-binding protein [Vagococcus allomyrinae]